MKKALALVALLTVGAQANETLKFKCEAPELNYIYRFSMEKTLEIYTSEEDENVANLWGVKLDVTARKAGNASQEEKLELPKLNGKLTKVEGPVTKDPFWNLKLMSKDKKVLVNLNLNYPTKLSSFVRTAEGAKYKATCKIVSYESCIFGGSLFDTLENDQVSKEELGTELKVIPDFNEDSEAVNTKKVNFTFKDGSTYTAWYTFEDEVDGGNTYGVIEDQSGAVAATIGDGDIYDCKAKQPVSVK